MAQYTIKKGDWTYKVYVEKLPDCLGHFKISAARPFSEREREWYKRLGIRIPVEPDEVTVDLDIYAGRRKTPVDYLLFRKGTDAHIFVSGEAGEHYKDYRWKRTGFLSLRHLLDLYNFTLWSSHVREIMMAELPFLERFFEKEAKKRREPALEKIFKEYPIKEEKEKHGLETILNTIPEPAPFEQDLGEPTGKPVGEPMGKPIGELIEEAVDEPVEDPDEKHGLEAV